MPAIPVIADLTFVKLLMNDKILMNKDFSKFSLIPIEGYRSWSEQLATDFKGYAMNEKFSLTNSTAPTLNFK